MKNIKKTKPEIYISIDIESNGPIPGENSMLSLGAAAYTRDKQLIGKFSMNLLEIPGSYPDSDTMLWWGTQKEAWAACRKACIEPDSAMKYFNDWVKTFNDKFTPVCVAYPAGFDFTFLHYYMMRYIGKNPFSFACLDIKTLAMALLGGKYRESGKRSFPKHWFDDLPHTHIAVDDAVEQGAMFCNMLKDLDDLHDSARQFNVSIEEHRNLED